VFGPTGFIDLQAHVRLTGVSINVPAVSTFGPFLSGQPGSCRRDGHVRSDAVTIPDYVAIGILLTSLLAAARWFAQRKFEL